MRHRRRAARREAAFRVAVQQAKARREYMTKYLPEYRMMRKQVSR